ncbi:hypothetical protein LINPERHAP1_LOCUS30397 [Linum perenne]
MDRSTSDKDKSFKRSRDDRDRDSGGDHREREHKHRSQDKERESNSHHHHHRSERDDHNRDRDHHLKPSSKREDREYQVRDLWIGKQERKQGRWREIEEKRNRHRRQWEWFGGGKLPSCIDCKCRDSLASMVCSLGNERMAIMVRILVAGSVSNNVDEDEAQLHSLEMSFDGDVLAVELLPKDQWHEEKSLSILDEVCRDIDDALHCMVLPNGNFGSVDGSSHRRLETYEYSGKDYEAKAIAVKVLKSTEDLLSEVDSGA